MISFLVALILLLSFDPASAAKAKVISVHDGDTVTLQDGTHVRLYGIDCPEIKQPYGVDARSYLVGRIASQRVDVNYTGARTYSRVVGEVFVGGRSVNKELVAAGQCWAYTTYLPKAVRNEWLVMEARARAKNLGLWKDPNPIAPWDWRKGKR